MLIDITPTKLGGARKADTTSAHRLAGEKEHKTKMLSFLLHVRQMQPACLLCSALGADCLTDCLKAIFVRGALFFVSAIFCHVVNLPKLA